MKKYSFGPDELAAFCLQTAMLINSGIPLYEATNIVTVEEDDEKAKKVLGTVNELVSGGLPLNEALKKTDAFPKYMVEMIKVGEETGRQEEVLNNLAAYYERESKVSQSIKNVIFYPAVLFTMMGAILVVLVTKILPLFENVFLDLENKTAATETMMKNSIIFSRILMVIVLIIVFFIVSTIILFGVKNGSGALDKFIDLIPFTKKLADKLGIGKFFASLSGMIKSGVDYSEAVKRSKEVVEFVQTREKITFAERQMENGEAFDEALLKAGILSGMQASMLAVGVKTGNSDVVLAKLSERMDIETEERMTELSAKVETILVIILALIIGAILVSVMIPLVSVIASI